MNIERITAAQATHQAQDWDLPVRRVDERGRVFEHGPGGRIRRVIWEDDFEFVVSLETVEKHFAWAM